MFSILLAISPFQIDEVEVTGVQIHSRTDSCQVAACVTHSEIAHLPITNVADILAYLSGVDIRSRGASNSQTDISMRGGTFDQVIVLLNGIPLQDTQTGHYTLNIPISSELIERIEVLQGTGANMTGALTGAINIITRKAQEDTYTMTLSAGTNGDIHPAFSGSWARKDVFINTSVEYGRSEGYYAPNANDKEHSALQNTDYQLANLYFQTRWRGLDVQAGAQYKDAGLGTGYGYASTDQFDATRTMFVSSQYEHFFDNWKIDATLAYRGQHDRYEWYRGTITNRHWTHNTQAAFDAQYLWPFAGGVTRFGVAFRDEYISSTNMGKHNRWQATLHAEQQFRWRFLSASLSLAGHYNSWCKWYGSGIAHIDCKFDHGRGVVYLDASHSLRMPTWTDMYYHAGVQRGNTNLKAERAWQICLGGQYNRRWKDAGQLHLAADIYYRWGQDIIDWNYNETDSLIYATNHNKINTFGIDITAHYRLNSWLRGIALRYAYTSLSPDITRTQSMYLNYLQHKVVLTIDHGIYVWSKGCLGANWSLRWQSRAGTYVDIYGVPGNAYKPVLLLDGSIYVDLPHVRIAAECTNMTNRHYYDFGGILMPGAHGIIRITAFLNEK